MADNNEKYHGVTYFDLILNPNTTYDPIVISFINGDVTPMINDVNQQQYNHVYCSMTNELDNAPDKENLIAQQVDNYVELIKSCPSITYFYVRLDVHTSQATTMAQSMLGTNINSFTLISNDLSKDGMSDFMSALSDAHIEIFTLEGNLDDATVAAMNFSQTQIRDLAFDFDDNSFSGDTLPLIFDNLAGSQVSHLLIFGDQTLTAQTAAQIDLSQTNISYLEFWGFSYGENALSQLSFENSQVNTFEIYSPDLSGDDLKGLSATLEKSEVSTLHMELPTLSEGDLVNLHLQNTPVENLGIFCFSGIGSELANLDLSNTNVKNLNLIGITDANINLLNFENTLIEHVDLGYCPHLSQQGLHYLIDNIADTHVIDVRFSFYSDDWETFNEYVITNDIVLPSNSEAISLSDVINNDAYLFDSSPVVKHLANESSALIPPIMHIEHHLTPENALIV